MTQRPIVLKLGGDALASPERIADAARRVVARGSAGPVIAVVSARRGVTDHLLGLVDKVRSATGGSGHSGLEADRAVAAGEIVAASLLALALRALGADAVSLDAREAGLRSSGSSGKAHIRAVASGRLKRLLADGVVPVVTGFQGWSGRRVVTLGRGGTDITAVALAVALDARLVEFVKEAAGLRTADPKLVPEAHLIDEASHGFLSAVSRAGSRVIHADAARLAERRQVPLEFHPLDGDPVFTRVTAIPVGAELRAVVTGPAEGSRVRITALSDQPFDDPAAEQKQMNDALGRAGILAIAFESGSHAVTFAVPSFLAATASRAVHSVFIQQPAAGLVRRAS